MKSIINHEFTEDDRQLLLSYIPFIDSLGQFSWESIARSSCTVLRTCIIPLFISSTGM